jgi:glyoxylase-like metal-dependent hydrolase (beta-lactamase superfamily II)
MLSASLPCRWLAWAWLLIPPGAVAAEPSLPVQLISGGPYVLGEQPDGNSVLIHAPAGAILIATGRHSTHVEAVERTLAESGQPLAAIINTHWHLDHVGGNVALRHAHPGIPVYATDAIQPALGGFLADYRRTLHVQLQEQKDPARQAALRSEMALIDAGQALAPDHVVNGSGTVRIADLNLELHVEHHAHTDGDLWVVDRRDSTVVAGDLVVLPTPFLDTSCAHGIADALRRIARVRFDRLLPGHGPAMSRSDFARYRVAFDHLLGCAESTAAPTDCAAGWRRDLGPLLPESDYPTANALIGYYLESNLRNATARARWCAAS